MEKRKVRIGELAQALNIKRFVIRFWEKEFELKAERSFGGQRFYNEQDIGKFMLIKDLLYTKKYTIAGAKTYLKKMVQDKNSATVLAASKTSLSESSLSQNTKLYTIIAQLQVLQKKLLRLKELL